jgi:hypothetical protein
MIADMETVEELLEIAVDFEGRPYADVPVIVRANTGFFG